MRRKKERSKQGQTTCMCLTSLYGLCSSAQNASGIFTVDLPILGASYKLGQKLLQLLASGVSSLLLFGMIVVQLHYNIALGITHGICMCMCNVEISKAILVPKCQLQLLYHRYVHNDCSKLYQYRMYVLTSRKGNSQKLKLKIRICI